MSYIHKDIIILFVSVLDIQVLTSTLWLFTLQT